MGLDRNFFNQDTIVIAKELLGKYLVRTVKRKVRIGKIVETEAYIGEDDLACHAAKGRTNRTEIMYGEAGHAYIYMIYGMYHCLNIVTGKEGFPAAVLIRAVEPVGEVMNSQKLSKKVKYSRNMTKFDASQGEQMTANDLKKLASGPGKLCRWMEIDRDLNGEDVTESENLFIVSSVEWLESSVRDGDTSEVSERSEDSCEVEEDRREKFEIVEAKRIGVDYAKHCALHSWRFYIKDNEFVSKK